MRMIFAALIMLGGCLQASNWLLDPNTVLCTVVGESTMNGNPESIDKSSCKKLSEYKDEGGENPKRSTKPFCEFDFETGRFSTSYGEIPGAVIEKYNNRTYSGWSGKVKYIEDRINIGIDILEEIKKCNIEASQFMNEYLKKKSVEGFGKASFLYNEPGSVFDTYNEVLAFINSSLDLYDCSYDCEVHRESTGSLTSEDMLENMGNGQFSLNAVRNNTLYSACKAMKVGCLEVFVDNKDVSEKLREGLWLKGEEGEDGLLEKIESTRDGLMEKVQESMGSGESVKVDTTKLNAKMNEYLNYPNRKVNEYLRGHFLDSANDPFSNMMSATSTCAAPRGSLSFDLPDLNLCNLDGFDSDFFKGRMEELKEQLRAFKEQLIEMMMMNMVNAVMNSMDKIKYINELQAYTKKAQCLVQATVLQATDTESIMAAQEKFASCRKTPQKTETSSDAQAGGKWFTAMTPSGPIMIGLAQGTAGGGITLDPKAVLAATDESISCITASMGAAYEKAYEKCLKGEEFSLTTDFMATLKVDIIPELDEVKQMQCELDKKDNREDYFKLVEEEVKENYRRLKKKSNARYLKAVKERLTNSSAEDIAKVVSEVENNEYDETPVIEMFIKENVRQCLRKKIEEYEKTKPKSSEPMTVEELRAMQAECTTKREFSPTVDIAEGVKLNVSESGKDTVFELVVDSAGTNSYKISFMRLFELFEKMILELRVEQIDLENEMYKTIYQEGDNSQELMMKYHNNKRGMGVSVFETQVSEIQKKIDEVRNIPFENEAKMEKRRLAISNIQKRCMSKRLTRSEKRECINFRKNSAILKIYGGVANGN